VRQTISRPWKRRRPRKQSLSEWIRTPERGAVQDGDKNRNTRRNLLSNCYQKHASGFGAESWGIGPFTLHLKQLDLCQRVTYALRVLAPQKTTSSLPEHIYHLAPGVSFSDYGERSKTFADLPTSCLPTTRPESHFTTSRKLVSSNLAN
jgi:hypothetical protein